MTVQAMARVLDLERIKPTDKFVLLVIANHVNRSDALAWPKLRLIAAETGYGVSTVRQAISTLKSEGVLHVDEGGGRRPNVFWIDFARAEALYGRHKWAVQANETPPDAGGLGPEGASRRRAGLQIPAGSPPAAGGVPRQDLAGYKEPSSEPSTNPEGEPARGAAAPAGEAGAAARPGNEAQRGVLSSTWRQVRAQVRAEVGDKLWRSWLSQVWPAEDRGEGGLIVYGATSPLIAKHVQGHHAMREALGRAFGRGAHLVQVEPLGWVHHACKRQAELDAQAAEDTAALEAEAADEAAR